MATTVHMPEVLTGITEAAIQSWLVEPGQEVSVGTPLAEVETEKAVVEYAAESEGTVLRLLVDAGASVSIGDAIAVIGAPGESADDADDAGAGGAAGSDAAKDAQADVSDAAPTAPPAVTVEAATTAEAAHTPVGTSPSSTDDAATAAPGAGAGAGGREPSAATPVTGNASATEGTRLFASPIVRRLAKERQIELSDISGTGPNGRIVRRDIEAYEPAPAERDQTEQTQAEPAKPPRAEPAAPASAAQASAGSSAAAEEVPLTPMRRAIARRVVESKSTVPHFYLTADCRVDNLLELRREVNASSSVRVSLNDFVLKACAGAFAEVPEANATWGETVIHCYSRVDIAVAVAIEGGLLTPVVREVDRLSIGQVASAVADLAERGRSGRLKQEELEGGSFSVSNLGMYGTSEFSAIINPPHAGILAVGAAREVPVVDDGALAVGTVMTVTLSADHRVLDGALAAQWLAAFVKRIENPLSILVE